MIKETHEIFLSALGRAIRDNRLALGTSQEGLAFDAGLHRTYLSAIERGERNPSVKSLLRISKALSVALSTLFNDAERHAASRRSGGAAR